MTEARILKGSGAGDPQLPGQRTRSSANNVSKSESINVCPECGSPLQFGSRDPCEGDFYWCPACGAGPVLFPSGTAPRPVPGVIDAESLQRQAIDKLLPRGKKYQLTGDVRVFYCKPTGGL